ncbi:hypothetical protein G3I40_12345 [Streptomyces sp. SID14478]|uniref:hypothetical protein n=1 Tax=Streptomyces sp. SID14478 TaxID=2706073 RepID=UPI0013D9D7F3|nr:hypothetical protein [Streptomyces sp. SID14478]NEB76005.1 hypothetical protein [Streptomyces sp. SID14478]
MAEHEQPTAADLLRAELRTAGIETTTESHDSADCEWIIVDLGARGQIWISGVPSRTTTDVSTENQIHYAPDQHAGWKADHFVDPYESDETTAVHRSHSHDLDADNRALVSALVRYIKPV